MNTLVYRKTVKGQQAIATRTHGLAARLRSLLILVDGRRSRDALEALASGFGDIDQMLGQLQVDGFIESPDAGEPAPAPGPTTAAAATAAAAPAPAATRATPSAPTVRPAATTPATATLAQAKQLATRQLNQLLGPAAEASCLRVEKARNRAEFIESIRRAYAIVAEARGRAQADAFGAIIEANLPPQ